MIEIDQGICVTGITCSRIAVAWRNDHEGERKYLELARDAADWDSSMMYIPKPYAIYSADHS